VTAKGIPHVLPHVTAYTTMDGGEVLPGFRLPIAQLYEAVTKPA
jgi:hypothetical protein